MTSNLTIEELKTIIFQLPVEELIKLISEIEKRLETMKIMQLAETGCQEWNDPEEYIYHD